MNDYEEVGIKDPVTIDEQDLRQLLDENKRLREENRRLKQQIKEHDPSGV